MKSFTGVNNRLKTFFLSALMSLLFGAGIAAPGEVTIIDARHYSNVFGETRYYRIFLPPGYYQNPEKRYPVIYFFHGWSQRYFGSSNPYGDFDRGDDNGGDNIANFVANHEVIVVKADGYNRSPDEPYYVRPYNVLPVETYRQFPIYFPELVDHIDASYRTIADREHRGISGLSMGGFMTFWIGGKYPHLLSAAGNFCGSPEFLAGPKDFPVEYRHLDMYNNYGGMNVRLHYGDKDFIRGYHEDLNKVWMQVLDNYSYKIFDAAHSTCGMGEMLGFILKTFENPPAKPSRWHHTDVYPVFSVWDYTVMTDRTVPGYTIIENVDARGFRCSVREFLPDGKLMPGVKVSVKTSPLYEKEQLYTVNDINTRTLTTTQRTVRSDKTGALTIELNGDSHEIGINRQNDEAHLAIASVNIQDKGWATAGENVKLSIKIVNKGMAAGKGVRATLSATRPTAEITGGDVVLGNISVNGNADAALSFRVKADTAEIERFKLTLRDSKKNEWIEFFDVAVKKKLPDITTFVIADGKTLTVAKSGKSVETVKLGHGNGDGVANPGESIVILVNDNDTLRRADLTGKDRWINPYGVNIRKSDNWSSFDYVGGSAKYDVPLIASDCPQNHPIEFFVEYWLADYPLHIIKRGVVRFSVKGKDTTPPVIVSAMVTGDNVLQVAAYDGSMIRSVKATLIAEKDPGKSVVTTLTDDGQNGDRAEGDLVFSQTIPSQVFGIFTVKIEMEDSFGNKSILVPDEQFVLH